MVRPLQRPVDEQRSVFRAARIALGQKLQIPDDHCQRRADIVGDGLDELLLLLELGVLGQQKELDGAAQVIDIGRQGRQLRVAANGDLLAEILAAQRGDVLLHFPDVSDMLLKQKKENRNKGGHEQHSAHGLAQGGVGLVKITAEIDLAGLVL